VAYQGWLCPSSFQRGIRGHGRTMGQYCARDLAYGARRCLQSLRHSPPKWTMESNRRRRGAPRISRIPESLISEPECRQHISGLRCSHQRKLWATHWNTFDGLRDTNPRGMHLAGIRQMPSIPKRKNGSPKFTRTFPSCTRDGQSRRDPELVTIRDVSENGLGE
jgi:hypothetical protein